VPAAYAHTGVFPRMTERRALRSLRALPLQFVRKATSMRARRRPTLATLSLLALAACSNGGSSTAGGATNVVIKPNVTVLADEQIASATVTEDSITLPSAGNEALANLPVGTVLVSGYQDGFIRKLSAAPTGATTQALHGVHTLGGVTSAFIRLLTVPATLTDAVSSANFDWTLAPTPLSLDANDALAGTEQAGVTIAAKMSLSPSIHVTGQIVDGSVTSFTTTVVTTASDTVSSALSFDGSKSWSGSAPVGSTSQRFLKFLGPVPVVGKVTLSLTAGYAAAVTAKATVSVGATCELTYTNGISYAADSGWDSTSSTDKECSVSGPTLGLRAGASASVYLSPKVQLAFWGVGGPFVSAQVGATASINACPQPSKWSVNGYINGTVGANASVLGISGQYMKTVASVTYPIADDTFHVSACSPDAGVDGGSDAGFDASPCYFFPAEDAGTTIDGAAATPLSPYCACFDHVPQNSLPAAATLVTSCEGFACCTTSSLLGGDRTSALNYGAGVCDCETLGAGTTFYPETCSQIAATLYPAKDAGIVVTHCP